MVFLRQVLVGQAMCPVWVFSLTPYIMADYTYACALAQANPPYKKRADQIGQLAFLFYGFHSTCISSSIVMDISRMVTEICPVG